MCVQKNAQIHEVNMNHFNPTKVSKYLSRKIFTLVAGGILLFVVMATSVFIVDQTEVAVITRFGKYVGTRGAGLQFKLPFGIERSYIVNVTTTQEQAFDFRAPRTGGFSGAAQQPDEIAMLTGDLNILDVTWTITYRVEDAFAWTFNVLEEHRIPTIRDVSRMVINQLVGDRGIENIMVGAGRTAIEAEGVVIMNELLRRYGLGINVIAVNLQNVLPPPGEVQAAFDDVNRAGQDRERLINEGQQMYNEQVPRAHGEAQRLILVAQGYAAARVNHAQGDVARFNAVLAEFQRAPEVTRQRLYFEMMEEVFGDEKNTTLVDHNLRNFLPLMNIGN
jgi:membrane protease subunit HflK